MTHDEILGKVREVIVDALAVDEDKVTPEATLFGDLGAESIDILDIQFKLEQAFGFKIAEGEMLPQGSADDPTLVSAGRLTAKGTAALRARMPHLDFAGLGETPAIEEVAKAFKVQTLVNFVANKLSKA